MTDQGARWDSNVGANGLEDIGQRPANKASLPILMTPPDHKPQNRHAKIPRYLAARVTENTIWRLRWSQ
jgi:hypothetical protein